MKKTKIIVPALGMLLLSTAASVTGTVAWFAVNTEVSVTGLQVKAKAEGGIVIAPYTLTPSAVSAEDPTEHTNTKTNFSFVAPGNAAFGSTATHSLPMAELYPTSTANVTGWYHATSDSYNSHAATSSYVNVAGQAGWQADGKLIEGAGTVGNLYKISGQYFLYNKYVVKSTTSADTFDLFVRTITVTDDNEPANETSANLNQSLRVAMKVGDADPVFFAPKRASAPANPYSETGEGPYTQLQCYNGSAKAAASLNYGLTPNVKIADNTVVNAGVDLQIWVYYEGEDPECKTVNIDGITVDGLSISFGFATTAAA